MSAQGFLPMDFGSRLKTLRENRNMNQRALADALDGVISQSGISRMENGDKQPTTSDLLALSWALGVSLDELTDPVPLSERKTWAARSEGRVDVSQALDRLTAQLQLRNTLDQVSRANVS
ncbi:helix-turn-helix domain-containing protein [Burkholderia cenocepacia]|uniref:helix-turn-helix domain-containing protein n=1 Tax=Burkholderia cenocepacia TaxID=95486 RepID=UPI002237E6CE|nr:helix-turn-helix transcriptional regulator [Burkholderia cenocepacia]MCW5185426.1 helix-turn-helix domain-containing protein [Burkholderia cenocepacia]